MSKQRPLTPQPTSQDTARAEHEGRTAEGKTYVDCPYGHDQPALRKAWCQARTKAIEAGKPFFHRLFFGSNPVATIFGWIIFIALAALSTKVIELFFGCVDEFGRRYSC